MSKIFPSGKAAEAKAESSKSQFATSRLTISSVRILQARYRLLSPRRWSGYFGVCDLVAFFSRLPLLSVAYAASQTRGRRWADNVRYPCPPHVIVHLPVCFLIFFAKPIDLYFSLLS